MTLEDLCAATGATAEFAKRYLTLFPQVFTEFEINTPQRQAAFLAQVGHESGGLKWTREIWGPSPEQFRYEGRPDLGNIQAGDGFRYRGRGLIQITGRANYAAAGRALNLPLIGQPALLEAPVNAARSAGWYWHERGLNEIAQQGDFKLLTKKINGGLNGYKERVALWEKAREVIA